MTERDEGSGPEGPAQTHAQRRARVTALFADLGARGLRRQRGQSVDDHLAMQARLADFCAWLEPEMLEALGEIISGHATGTEKNRWPDEVTVENLARGLSKWAGTSELVASYMRSVEGPRAWRRGFAHAHALCRYLEKLRRPPNGEGAWAQIADHAEESARRVALAKSEIARGLDAREAAAARAFLGMVQRRREYLARLIFSRLNRGVEDDGTANRERLGAAA